MSLERAVMAHKGRQHDGLFLTRALATPIAPAKNPSFVNVYGVITKLNGWHFSCFNAHDTRVLVVLTKHSQVRGVMMKRLGYLGRGLVLAGVLLGSASSASAAPMLFTLQSDDNSAVTADVLFTYSADSPFTGRIDLAITNTSTADDPELSGFAFNVPLLAAVTGFSSSLSGWSALYFPNGVDTPGNFGRFDVGAGGGSGLARNATATFSFDLAGLGLNTYTENSFLGLNSYDPFGAPVENVDYFYGLFTHAGPDGRGYYNADPNGSPVAQRVPEPSTLLLSSLGVLGAAALRRRQA